MNARVDAIKERIAELRRKDHFFGLFGASYHRYVLNPVLTETELVFFERKHNIVLPTEYREFLSQVGNGGAGPSYGVEPLQYARFADLDRQDMGGSIDPSQEFMLTGPWNMDMNIDDEDLRMEREKEYYDTKWANGLLRISNYGCGAFVNIVVNGSEYGNIWLDDRCNDVGIFPYYRSEVGSRIGFFDWYEEWLDKALAKT